MNKHTPGRWIYNKWIDFTWWWNVYRGTKCRQCADGYFYPMYGMAPHNHNVVRAGGFIGSTEIKDKHEWPNNFIEDEPGAGQGMWFCPNPECPNSRKRATGQSINEITAATGREG